VLIVLRFEVQIIGIHVQSSSYYYCLALYCSLSYFLCLDSVSPLNAILNPRRELVKPFSNLDSRFKLFIAVY